MTNYSRVYLEQVITQPDSKTAYLFTIWDADMGRYSPIGQVCVREQDRKDAALTIIAEGTNFGYDFDLVEIFSTQDVYLTPFSFNVLETMYHIVYLCKKRNLIE